MPGLAALPLPVREALRAALPDLDPAAIDAAEAIGEGWGSLAFHLRDARGGWVLRLPRPEAPWALGGLAREARLLPALAAAGLPVPRDTRPLLDPGGRLLGTVHRYVEGRAALPRHLRGARRRERLARQLGEFFTRLHAFPSARAEALGIPEGDLWAERYRPMLEHCWPLLGPRSAAWLDATIERFLAEGGTADAPRVLIHGDIAARHLLLDDDAALAGVIDFGDALIADPALDFAGLLNEHSWSFMERVLAHYGGEVDPQLRRRARFFIAVAPLYSVRYGDAVRGGQERIDGLLRLAARAAAATRAASP